MPMYSQKELEGKTNQELAAMIEELDADPANRNPPGSIEIFTKASRKIADRIREQIMHNQTMARKAKDPSFTVDGYSGRKQNRR